MEGTTLSLVAARKNANLTQKDVAKALNVNTVTVVNWESGKTEPRISQAKALASLYGLNVTEIRFP